MVGHFLNVICLFKDNSSSVTFANNKAFGCSILYVRFGNSVKGIVFAWFAYSLMYYLISVYSNNDITETNGGTYQSKSAYYNEGAYTIRGAY